MAMTTAFPFIDDTPLDPKFERAQTFEFLKGLGAKEINEVAA